MKIVAIVQARMSSSRLRGKVLKPLGEKLVLEHVVMRLSRAEMIDEIVVATTVDAEDDVLVDWCKKKRISFFRGQRDNVLARFYECAVETHADAIVRVTSDNPLLDPAVVDRTIRLFKKSGADYAANNLVKSFPHGLDVEVISFAALSQSWREAGEGFELEHVTQFVRHRPERFKLVNLKADADHHDIRITLDEPDDYQLIRLIYRLLGDAADYRSIVDLFADFPVLHSINSEAGKSHAEYNQSQKIV
ncbi:MAG: glycosyltransferase family protein [Chromatiales bacterium]|jgi:spore coat polysaccharide biosynthesis protein SpsF